MAPVSGNERSQGSVTASRHASTKREEPRTRTAERGTAHGLVDRRRDPERVVSNGQPSTIVDERVLAGRVLRGLRERQQPRAERVLRVELSERRPEPLRVRRVAALLQEAEAHDVAHELRRDDRRTELVADLCGAADERLLLVDAAPLTGHEPEPDVVRVPAKSLAHGGQLAGRVVEDGARGDLEEDLLRRREPVDVVATPRRDRSRGAAEPRFERGDLDVVRHGHVVPAEPSRPAAKRRPEARRSTAPRAAARLARGDEHLKRGPQP